MYSSSSVTIATVTFDYKFININLRFAAVPLSEILLWKINRSPLTNQIREFTSQLSGTSLFNYFYCFPVILRLTLTEIINLFGSNSSCDGVELAVLQMTERQHVFSRALL